MNDRIQRAVPYLLLTAVGLLATSVLLQSVVVVALLRGHVVPVEIANRRVPVEVENEVGVNLRNHYIFSIDPIPVRIER